MSGKSEPRMRRAELVRRAESQREELATQLQQFQPLFQGIDRGMSALGWLKRHIPTVAAGAGVVALVLGIARPVLGRRVLQASSRALPWAGAVMTALQTVRDLRSR